ncbi:cyclin-like protein [Xylaria palmicola]|nr:cyclin-like protein [Xylaria palmicola]
MAATDSQMGDASDADVAGASATVSVSASVSASAAGSAGPSMGVVKSGRQYLHESTIRRKLANLDTDLSRDEAARIQGVQLIDDVRSALQLPIITYIAACGYYHRFRLEFDNRAHQWSDMALACLFVACKSEDTLKKSRDIVCANHNLKNPDRTTTPDDKIFDQGSKLLINIERHVIETLRFDFQVRNPFKILAKIVKQVLGPDGDASGFFVDAFKGATDMYKTFAPLKHTTFTCAFAVARLTALTTGRFADTFAALDPTQFYTSEEWVAEVMLDVLDLYTDHSRSTLLGQQASPQTFIEVKIKVNQQMEAANIPRYQNFCGECDREGFPSSSSTGSSAFPVSPSGTNGSHKRASKGQEGTFRFLFNADEVHLERAAYEAYAKDEWEEWEEEVEEPIPEHENGRRGDLGPEPRAPRELRGDLGPEPRAPPREPRGSRGYRGHGRGRGRGGRGGHDPNWHPRGRHDYRGRGRGSSGGGGGGGGP